MTLSEHHVSMAKYDAEATARAIVSLRSVPTERRGEPAFAKACGILAHVQMAKRLWLSRLGAVERPTWVMFPAWSIDEIERDAHELDRVWGSHIAGLDDLRLAERVRYTSVDGVGFESTVAEILTHVHNHGTYHRGQVAMLATSVGGERASTDYIAITRKRVDGDSVAT